MRHYCSLQDQQIFSVKNRQISEIGKTGTLGFLDMLIPNFVSGIRFSIWVQYESLLPRLIQLLPRSKIYRKLWTKNFFPLFYFFGVGDIRPPRTPLVIKFLHPPFRFFNPFPHFADLLYFYCRFFTKKFAGPVNCNSANSA